MGQWCMVWYYTIQWLVALVYYAGSCIYALKRSWSFSICKCNDGAIADCRWKGVALAQLGP
eukprot:10447192-Karenia_brevis.AAC.1